MTNKMDELELELMGVAEEPAKPAKAEKKPSKPISEAAPEVIKKNTIRIHLEESDDIPPSGLFLQHNGRPYMLKTGVDADIPLFLKEILDNAVIEVPVINPDTRQIVGWRKRLKYNYRIVT